MPDPRSSSLRVRVTDKDLKRVRAQAKAERRTVSQLVWVAVLEYLDRAKNGKEPS